MKSEMIDVEEVYRKRYSNKGLICYFAVAFGCPWLLILMMKLTGMQYGGPQSTVILTLCMFMPTIGVLAASLVTKSTFYGIGLNPNFKGNGRWYLAAWFLPILIILAGAGVYFLLQSSMFDTDLTLMKETLKSQGIEEGRAKMLLGLSFVQGIVLAPIVNVIPTLGEELGWRGFLLPALMRRMSVVKAVLASGLIWGIWHAPMIAMGHNYGTDYPGYPWLGILGMCIFCVSVGCLESFLTLKTKSAVPAAVVHSGINGFCTYPIMFCKKGFNVLVGPTILGILGGSIMILIAVFCILSIRKGKLGEE